MTAHDAGHFSGPWSSCSDREGWATSRYSNWAKCQEARGRPWGSRRACSVSLRHGPWVQGAQEGGRPVELGVPVLQGGAPPNAFWAAPTGSLCCGTAGKGQLVRPLTCRE